MTSQRVRSSETTEYYLVQLLVAFVRPSRSDLLDPPLALDYMSALQLPARARYDRLRRVADTALFLTGLFLERLERTLVGPRYYVSLGRSAYARLSSDVEGSALASSFEELAVRFPDFVRVLAEIADREIFRGEPAHETLRLYRRWLLTGDDRDEAALVERGMIPYAPADDHEH